MQAIQAGDLFRQVQELGREGVVNFARFSEIARQRDQGLLEIARELNREDRPLGVNAREALDSLGKRGSVIEVAEPRELMQAAVQKHLTESRRLSHHPDRASAGDSRRCF